MILRAYNGNGRYDDYNVIMSKSNPGIIEMIHLMRKRIEGK